MKPPRVVFRPDAAARLLGSGRPWARTLYAAVLIAAALLCAAAGFEATARRAELRALRVAPVPATPLRAAVPRLSAEVLHELDATTARLNVRWPEVFAAVERRTPHEVTLRALAPDARSGTVAVAAEAASIDVLLAYAEGLALDPAVASVEVRQHETRTGDGRVVGMALALKLAGARTARR